MKSKTLLPPLDAESFANLMGDTFRSANMALTSVVQGVAFGVLLLNAYQIFLRPGAEFPWHIVVYPLMSFISLVTVTFEYSHYVGVFGRAVNVTDVYLPYLVGITEIAPMFFFSRVNLWWFCQGVFVLVAAISWLNSARHCSDEVFGENNGPRGRYKRTMYINSAVAVPVGALSVTGSFYILSSKSFWLESTMCVAMLSFGVFITLKSQHLIWGLQRDFGFEPIRRL